MDAVDVAVLAINLHSLALATVEQSAEPALVVLGAAILAQSRKVGGIRFFRLGRARLSFCIARRA